MESATEPVVAARAPRTALRGEVVYIRAFDLAYDMKRQRIPQILGQPVRDYVAGPSKPGPKRGFFYRPQMVTLPPETYPSSAGPLALATMTHENGKGVVIVAHPDDETLWAGGTLLLHPDCRWTVVTLTRRSDADRAPRFTRAVEHYGATGIMGDLDDGPEQRPLRTVEVEDAILDLLPSHHYDWVLTHGLWGEYTRHRRHEEVAKAVVALRESGRLSVGGIWRFAYQDEGGKHLSRPVENADRYTRLPPEIWERKYRIITDVYGFGPDSFEARTTPRDEAFWIMGKGK